MVAEQGVLAVAIAKRRPGTLFSQSIGCVLHCGLVETQYTVFLFFNYTWCCCSELSSVQVMMTIGGEEEEAVYLFTLLNGGKESNIVAEES